MTRKKKKTTGGSLRGFALLLIVTAIALFVYQHQEGKAWINLPIGELKETAANSLSGSMEPQAPSSQLEIPVSTRKRNEIRLKRTAFTLSYNNDYKTPNWVAWELTRDETKGTESRKSKFEPDPNLPEPHVEHSDYTNSGYDRGHMAPAADMKWSEKAMEESFYMSNICPQNRKLNRDDWGDLEEKCREWAKKYGRVYIACGPIYDKASPKRIGKHQVAVPDRFFKVVLIYNRKNPIAMGFLFENKAHHQNLKNYMVKVDQVEEETGLDFFSKLPDDVENRIESIVESSFIYTETANEYILHRQMKYIFVS